MNNRPIYVLSVVVAVVFFVFGDLGLVIAGRAFGRPQEMALALTFWVAIVPWGCVILLVLIAGLERVVKGGMTGPGFSGLAALNLIPFFVLLGILLLVVNRT